jgi:hypothetical protein
VTNQAVLASVLERVETTAASGERPVVVLDVDSTLLSTSRRHCRILREYAEQSGDAALVAFVAALDPDGFGWKVSEQLRGTAHEHHIEPIFPFWWDRFFHPDYLREDVAVHGAVDFVKGVVERGGWAYYLTARHLPDMGAATVESLLRLGFPMLSTRTKLHLKPSKDVGDKPYKRGAMADIGALGTVVATFENDPGNANAFATAFPAAINVWMRSVWPADAADPVPELKWIDGFC